MLKKIFVYGTLRRDIYSGVDNGRVGVVEGHGEIQGTMYDLGAFPAILPSDDPMDSVKGQLISMEDLSDEDTEREIGYLDRYEGVPVLYVRDTTKVTLEDGEVHDAWVYYFADPDNLVGNRRIHSGDWLHRRGEARG